MVKKPGTDDAVSPVIATILLVAVVVILVAVISAAVLPMAGNLGTVKSASVTVTLNEAGTLPVVTLIGGSDAGSLRNLTVYVSNAVVDEDDGGFIITDPKVGIPYIPQESELNPVAGSQTVNVVGEFNDSTVQTLYTGTLVFK